ncbi:NAD(P)-dependent oxidoreductase [Mycobacterium sp. 1245805.9]|uniref:NAD(P)-dependent oxidoreductase n=1 Tax=Mycobacterium sp. 1245805.9 TaxID=1856862 RepID=UPI000801A931|nr:NAD(P)H-binding protein [Mycobacterium sp. 1245805.9]OBI81369.1 epimerase [Mycobacterium sp. 1245805.9]
MKVTVFGATGGVGRELVKQALGRGYDVVAVVRYASRLGVTHPALDVVTVTALDDPGTLIPAIRGSDAVLSAVGPRRRNDGPVASSSTRAILAAMNACSTKRFVGVSALPVGPTAEGERFMTRWVLLPVLKTVFGKVYADLAEMESLLQHSDVEWTVVRPPRLVDQPLTGKYRTVVGANVARGLAIARADVAHAMLEALASTSTIRQPLGVAY